MEVALGCFQTRVSPDQRCLGAEENRKMPFTNHCIYHKPAHLIKQHKSVQCQTKAGDSGDLIYTLYIMGYPNCSCKYKKN